MLEAPRTFGRVLTIAKKASVLLGFLDGPLVGWFWHLGAIPNGEGWI